MICNRITDLDSQKHQTSLAVSFWYCQLGLPCEFIFTLLALTISIPRDYHSKSKCIRKYYTNYTDDTQMYLPVETSGDNASFVQTVLQTNRSLESARESIALFYDLKKKE